MIAECNWGRLTEDEIAQARDEGALVVIPVGAIEQHAGHLPVDTDTDIVKNVCMMAARQSQCRVLVAPAVSYGFSPHHRGYASTLTLKASTLVSVVRDLAESLHEAGFPRILIVNGHGGNQPSLRVAVAELVTSGISAGTVEYWGPTADLLLNMLSGSVKRPGHACEFETALELALHEADGDFGIKVRRAVENLPARWTQPYFEGSGQDPIELAGAYWPPVFTGDTLRYYGDPSVADVGNGKAMLSEIVARLAGFYDDFSRAPLRVWREG